MASPQQRKGDKAEREVLAFLRDQLGEHITRNRLAGLEDRGDIGGLRGMTVQVKSYADITRAVREGIEGAAEQKGRAGTLWAAAFVRRPGGRYVVCMSPEDWVSMYREAVS